MYITVTIQFEGATFDISMDEQQRLFMGLKTLGDNHKIFYQKEPAFYRSEMQKRIISAYKTCQEEQIATGDKLIAII